MKKERSHCQMNSPYRWALLSGIAFLILYTQVQGQEAKVAKSSLQIRTQAAEKKIEVSVRLVDAPNVTLASASTEQPSGTKAVPTTWASFDSNGDTNCTWMVVIDNSNPARKKTVEACVREVRTFLSRLPASDTVMLATLARDFTVVAPFETKTAERDAALSSIKTDGESSLATLLYQNLRQAVSEHLEKRKETRKAVVLLTDGKDETPGGQGAISIRRDELIKKAKELGVIVHTIGFAELASEANWFADLKEISHETEGLHVAAEVSTRQLAPETWPTLNEVTRGGGTAVLDVSGLEKPMPIKLNLQTATGKRASVVIPEDEVAKALPVQAPIPQERTSTMPEQTAGDAKTSVTKDGAKESANAEVDAAPEKELMAKWMWWAVGGLATLLLIVFLITGSRRRAAEEERRIEELRRAEQARVLEEMLLDQKSDPSTVLATPAPFAYLEMCDADQTRHSVTVTNFRIGRGQHNDLVLRNDSVSGNHCTLSRNRQGEWVLTDLKSGNGLIVNGSQVKESALRHGDLIELGDLKMRFLLKM
jgi:FHA domain/von Willebrand factor type A domain